ncbi:MAG: septation ring formation regulator EzrA [Erysipelotrichaceae bacterium]|nr:septation ring formation regulator EzrA [Erysipelotrichaceae bacterium]
MEDMINRFFANGNNTMIFISVISVIALGGLGIFYRGILIRKYRKKVVFFEDEINSIRTLPIRYRLGRVKAIGQNAPEILEQYQDLETEFDTIETNSQNDILTLLRDLDERTYYRKLRGVKKDLRHLEKAVTQYRNSSTQLLGRIEEITEIENDQRLVIIATKEDYRNLFDRYNSLRYKIEDYVPAVKEKINEIDQDFIDIEEMMNAQKYLEAKSFTQTVKEKIEFLSTNLDTISKLTDLCKNYLPGQVDLVTRRKDELVERGFAINLLDASSRFDKITDDLASQATQLKSLDLEGLEEKINLTSKDLNSLLSDFTEEQVAFDSYASRKDKCFDAVENLARAAIKVKRDYGQLKENYVIEGYGITVEKDLEQIREIQKRKEELERTILEKEFAFSRMLRDFDDLIAHCNHVASNIEKYYIVDENLKIQEKRALDELDNISIVLLEIKSEISNNHLPMINESYKDYIEDSYAKAEAILKVTKVRPINLEELSLQVDAARDVIYKLYDNVHHLIVTAQMVEEAIMFGNRYRHSFLEVNTELTRAELLYRNGEYTNALKVAVDIIEKIAPGSYEKLIMSKEGE